jgi:hypothetical protein
MAIPGKYGPIDISDKQGVIMKQDAVRDVEKLYDQTLKFLQGEGIGEKPVGLGLSRTEYQNTFRTIPEKYLLKDNLLLLLKDV